MRIRDLSRDDWTGVLTLNNAAAPAVNELAPAELEWLAGVAAHGLVAEVPGAPEPAGFCLTMGPGLSYESLNYRWFSTRYESFTYLDRIVVDPSHRGSGIGAALYAELERRIAGRTPWLLCEVNVRPLNAGSLRFHQRIGFTEVGQQDTDGGAKRVSLLAKPL